MFLCLQKELPFTNILITAFLVFSIWIQYAIGKAVFNETPPLLSYAVQGQTVKLVWDYQVDNRNYEFEVNSPRWDFYEDVGTVLPIASEDSNYSWKFALHKDTCPKRLVNRVSKESTATLVIVNVTIADSGMYGCSLVLKMSSALTSKVKLVVTTIPYFTTKPPFMTSANESDDVNISCSASGVPKPNVTWVRIIGNETVVKRKGVGVVSLAISNITRNYSGIYKCRANNNPNERPVEALSQIIVKFSARFSYLPSKNNHVIENTYLELNCSADSLSQNVTWFHLHKGSKVLKSHGIGWAVLRFPRITRKNNGTYECRALSNIIGDTGISAFTEVIVMCDCITPSTESKKNYTKNMTDIPQNKTTVQQEETKIQDILNSKTFLIVLTITCISVLLNILLIVYICLKRNRYRVSVNGKETIRFGPPKNSKILDREFSNEPSPTRIIDNGSAEGIAMKPVIAIYERIPDPVESSSPKEAHPYATPSEDKSDQSPKAGNSNELRQSPKVSVLQDHYQDLDDFTLALNQQEYQKLNRSEACNPHPKHGPVRTPWKYETLNLNKNEKPSEYQKLHVYANVKEVKTGEDKQPKMSTFG